MPIKQTSPSPPPPFRRPPSGLISGHLQNCVFSNQRYHPEGGPMSNPAEEASDA